jgi:hypothetical protein
MGRLPSFTGEEETENGRGGSMNLRNKALKVGGSKAQIRGQCLEKCSGEEEPQGVRLNHYTFASLIWRSWLAGKWIWKLQYIMNMWQLGFPTLFLYLYRNWVFVIFLSSH